MKWGICVVVGLWAFSAAAGEKRRADVVSFELFVMSKCPFATRVEDTLFPLLKKFGKSVDFSLEFVGTEKDGVFSALHGESELMGNKIQLCASRYNPDRYMDLILCMNRDMRAIPEGWETCAKNAGIETADIRNCAEGQEGTGLLRYSFHKARDRRATGSPTMFIDKKAYNGGRSERAFTHAICGAFKGKQPKLCTSIPPPPKVEILVLSDKRCKDCQTERLAEGVGGLFYGSTVKVVDYGTKLGKKLYALVKPELLPILFFNSEVRQADNYDRIQFRLKEVGNYLVMPAGGRFDPTKEVCDNRVDDTGNGKVDCQDPDCQETLVCREEVPGQLEVFIMSQCPYCSRGMEVMRELLERFGDEMKFKIHYIAKESGDGFQALHGQSEVDENIRGLCVMKYYPEPKQFMKYFWCRMENIRSEEWIPCTGKNGIDTTMIEMCFTGGEGANLLRKDIKIADALEIYGSPTWLTNNRHKFNGIHLEVILENFCRYNKSLKGCAGVVVK